MDTPAAMTYASVVSRESVRIALLLAALNDLDVLSSDVQNAYLNAPPREKAWFRAGSKFGQYEGRVVVIIRALYGMASSAASWRNELSKTMRDLGFSSSWIISSASLRPMKPYHTMLGK